MNPQAAGELVHLWLEAHDDPGAVAQQRGPVSRAVRELAPDGKLTGIAETPTGPVMVVLLEAALLVIQARPLAALHETSVPVRTRLLRLDPAATEIEVTERFDGTAASQTRVHVWQLRAGGLDLRIEGTEVAHTGVEAGPDPNEVLGRTIATKLGWELP